MSVQAIPDNRARYTAFIASTLLVLGAWVFAAGRFSGTSSTGVAALAERQTQIEQRQTVLENNLIERLDKLRDADARIEAEIEGLKVESRLWRMYAEGKIRTKPQ